MWRWWLLCGFPAQRWLSKSVVAVFAVILMVAAAVFGVWATVTGSSVVFGRLTGLAGVFSLLLAVAAAAASMIAWVRRPADAHMPVPRVEVSNGRDGDHVGALQNARADRDVYAAARNLTITHNYFRDAGGQRVGPEGADRRIWGNIPARNPGFVGRDRLLRAVRQALMSVDGATPCALYGIGGVGKTQLAAEYVHQHAADYDIAWWIAAEQSELIGDQFAALADALGCAGAGTDAAMARRALLSALRPRDRWLLVFDNAGSAKDIAEWLPARSGHVLITSRTSGWDEMAVRIDVGLMPRDESRALLTGRVSGLAEADASRLAAALGDLPLALAQAAGYMTSTGIGADEYLDLLADRAAQVLDRGQPWSYPRSLAAVTRLAFDRLSVEEPAAASLAAVCAFLAPEPIPTGWFPRVGAGLPPPMAEPAGDALAWRQVLFQLSHHALARIDRDELQMHRLTQAILRDYLPPGQRTAAQELSELVLVVNHPGDTATPDRWAEWARLLPHVLAIDPSTESENLRDLALDASLYLIRRGDARSGCDSAERLHRKWLLHHGPENRQTLEAATIFASALREIGRYVEARQLDEDTLARRRQVLGEDHPETLQSAHNVACELYRLREYRAARGLHEDTLARQTRVLGQDHPDTLRSTDTLACMLSMLGERRTAQRLEEDTHARRRRVLGEDHPETLWSAYNLACILSMLGELQKARRLEEDTVARRRRVLGNDHPETLRSERVYKFSSSLVGVSLLWCARALNILGLDVWSWRSSR